MRIEVAVSAEKEPDFVSRQIMKYMGAPYSHIFFIHKGKHIGVDGKGVNVVDMDFFLKDHMIMGSEFIDLEWSEEYFLGWVEGNKGKEYSESQYLGFIFDGVKSLFSDGSKELICSEFVARALDYSSPRVLDYLRFGWDFDYVSPKELWEAVQRSKQ